MTQEASKLAAESVLKIPPIIVLFGKILQFFSLRLAAKFAARLFVAPVKFKIPKREKKMDTVSNQTFYTLPRNKKQICVYEYGIATKKVLLVHGWSGRGTQLVKIAEKLVDKGYQTISFDAPAHGKAKGKSTDLIEFIEAVHFLNNNYGPFEAAVGHSLGGMTLLNAISQGLKLKSLVIIGSGDIITDIMDGFIEKLGLKPEILPLMQHLFERNTNEGMNSYSASIAAAHVDLPVLIIHDEDDMEVPVKCAYHIHSKLKNAEIYITSGLGHRKILGNGTVVDKTLNHIQIQT